ncbi:uncharacterized protein LOC132739496 isoform X2 [Ruditapes philippinarum]|uniref:uncharacterized protein LOC132739496 isoform X2 n=1 Tax=Ruditapes philippinarum TaxID=129788 RepID=UPI00295BC2F0|nr:uncharacterized protein LOC132739496 isoform X2 [Ruditapes philippinarum]
MKLCLVVFIYLLDTVNSQNCVYSGHCAADVCPAGSAVHCLDTRCKCLTLTGAIPSSTCTQRSDCPLGACPVGNIMHCLDGHCKCIVDAVSMCHDYI